MKLLLRRGRQRKKMKYRKKPVVIEAEYYDGSPEMNRYLIDWTRESSTPMYMDEKELLINTLEGTMRVQRGDYVIKGAFGEFYPCKSYIFDATYERIE